MKKTIFVLAVSLVFGSTLQPSGAEVPGKSNRCRRVLAYYKICRDIKSVNGWKRVFHNNRLHVYTDKNILSEDRQVLRRCLYSDKIQQRGGL